MLINDTSNMQATPNQAGVNKNNSQLSQDDFLKLLVTQLKLQSPLNPFDSNTMMQQMSQLTTLSATQSMEKTVKSLTTNLGTSQVLAAAQLVGKSVHVPSEVAQLNGTTGLTGGVVLPYPSEQTSIFIRDASDTIIKRIDLGASAGGLVDFQWDGLDDSHNPMPAGFYKLSASMVANGETKDVPTSSAFRVNSVALDKNDNAVVLNLEGIGGQKLTDVLRIL